MFCLLLDNPVYEPVIVYVCGELSVVNEGLQKALDGENQLSELIHAELQIKLLAAEDKNFFNRSAAAD